MRRSTYITVLQAIVLVVCVGATVQGNVFAGFIAVALALALLWKLAARVAMFRLRRQGLL